MAQIKVLDKGYVELTGKLLSTSDDPLCAQTMDEMVVEAARVSFGQGLKGPEKDKKLLHYLIEHEHGTPFESVVFKFEIKCPIFTSRQIFRHRWGSFNEISGRYTDDIADDFYIPEVFRAQDIKNRQGSTDEDLSNVLVQSIGTFFNDHDHTEEYTLKNEYIRMLQHQQETYYRFLHAGLSKELARGILGTDFYTKFIWAINARSLMNFLILRCESHAQWEIQQYANAILNIFKQEMPQTNEGLMKYFPSIFGENDDTAKRE
jgi:thymidylate synthase (FAD)